jgi:hypothetical protein
MNPNFDPLAASHTSMTPPGPVEASRSPLGLHVE